MDINQSKKHMANRKNANVMVWFAANNLLTLEKLKQHQQHDNNKTDAKLDIIISINDNTIFVIDRISQYYTGVARRA